MLKVNYLLDRSTADNSNFDYGNQDDDDDDDDDATLLMLTGADKIHSLTICEDDKIIWRTKDITLCKLYVTLTYHC